MVVYCWASITPPLVQRLVLPGLPQYYSTTVQRQTAVTAYLKRNQLPLFSFARHNIRIYLFCWHRDGRMRKAADLLRGG